MNLQNMVSQLKFILLAAKQSISMAPAMTSPKAGYKTPITTREVSNGNWQSDST